MKVRTQTNLVKRGSVWNFRKKVPLDLRQHYGQESIRLTLSAFSLHSDAKREAARLASDYESQFALIRHGRISVPSRPLTAELIPQLAKALEGHILTADEEIRSEGMDEDAFRFWEAETEATAEEVRRAYARGDSSPIDAALNDWLSQLDIDATPGTPEMNTLRREFLKARLRSLNAKLSRNRGEIVDTPVAPSIASFAVAQSPIVIPAPRGGLGLVDVLNYWKGVGTKSHRTTATADVIVREFTTLHGNLPLSAITKSHFIALRDQQLARVKPATVQARFNLLKAAFTVCLQDDKFGITENPLQYVKIRKVEEEEKGRDAFTSDQLQTLFDSPVFTSGERPVGGRGEAAFWAPLIAMFTGARLDEILSLRTDGIVLVDGVHVFHIRHRPALGQKLKGKTKNNRKVPVHSELIRLGLLDYLKSVSVLGPLADGAGWLFRDVDRSDKVRNHSAAWGTWIGRYLTRCGIKSETLTFHSFRHTFKHFSRASGLPEDHQDAMTGHTTAEVARRYGSADGYPVEALAGSIKLLKFGKLDLLRVKGLVNENEGRSLSILKGTFSQSRSP